MGFQFQAPAAVSPLLIDDLAIGTAEIGFLIGIYMLPGMILALPGGLLGHQFGDKRMVAVGLVLMSVGGVTVGWVESYPMLLAGRVISGLGAILLNVLMTKMVTDWFAGREIVWAMAVFVNAFPVGIGLALLSLGWVGEIAGWAASFHATSAAAFAALLLVAFLYRRHPNDRQADTPRQTGIGIRRHEVALVCLAGLMWGLYNGAFTIVLGFAPLFLVTEGAGVSEAGFFTGLLTWLVVVSVQTGGMMAQRWGRADTMMLVGISVSGACLLVMNSASPAPVLVLTAVFLGLPAGVIVSLPARVLRPESRAIGMGLFFTWLYVGHALLPPLAGWLEEATALVAAPFYAAGLLLLSIVPIYAVFRNASQQTRPPAARSP